MQHHGQVRAGKRLPGAGNQHAAHAPALGMHAGGVYKDDLSIVLCQNAADSVAGGLRFWAHNGQLFAHKLV